MALVGRLLESHGFRVGILDQPDWRNTEAFKALGRPNLFWGVTAGNMDSMVNRYTSDRKMRSDDAYSPDGRGRAAAGSQRDRLRAAVPRGVRRCAARDRRHRGVACAASRTTTTGPTRFAARCSPTRAPICSSTAMPSARSSRSRIASRPAKRSRDPRSFAAPRSSASATASPRSTRRRSTRRAASIRSPIRTRWKAERQAGAVRDRRGAPTRRSSSSCSRRRSIATAQVIRMPSFEAVSADPVLYAHASRILHLEANPGNARALVQRHGKRDVWINPPPLPLTTPEMDALYELPFTRAAASEASADEVPRVRDDQVLGHDPARLLRRLQLLLDHRARRPRDPEPQRGVDPRARSSASAIRRPASQGMISDLGGPTANMYRMACKSREIEAACRKPSCVFPDVCENLEHRSRSARRSTRRRARSKA